MCESCGAAQQGCWCSEIKLSESGRDQLRARFRKCLCRLCLERFADGGASTLCQNIY
ncbi:MAG: cysteine-rich CWC family protein [Pyrinomonadaceae bacterium]